MEGRSERQPAARRGRRTRATVEKDSGRADADGAYGEDDADGTDGTDGADGARPQAARQEPVPDPAPGDRPDRPTGWRARVLPRSVLGISALILAFAIGAGFSGVVLYAYYQYHQNQTNDRVNALISGYKRQFSNAEGQLSATAAAAKAAIQSQVQAAQQLQADPATLAKLIKQLAPSLYFVHTLDTSGQPSVGTAFVISSNSAQSLLITSYTTIAAATHSPAPTVYIRHDGVDTPVTVQTWDAPHDLALLALSQGNLPAIPVAPASPSPQPGARVFVASGLGSAGGSITEGSVVDVSASGLAEDAAVGQAFQGGPIVNQAGQVIAVASRNYAPLGFTSNGVWYAPLVSAACTKVLHCPGGALPGS